GAGRMVPQDLLRIDLALRDGSFYRNAALTEAMEAARKPGAALHLMGLLSDGGVHSHQRHLFGLLKMARRCGVERVLVHAFTDGRDTPPRSALSFLEALEGNLEGGRVATVSGRYWAMDRDSRWDRVAKAYAALVSGEGLRAGSAREAIESAYARGETDEFVTPTVVSGPGGAPRGIRAGAAAFSFNSRPARARQLTRALTEQNFAEFPRGAAPPLRFVPFTRYKKEFTLPVAFSPLVLREILAEAWAEHGV